ncbi:hypothetical protein J4226_04370 [Candidatus Pacearchaeota archaeon]|nr:hypothetical protein [Candidatus Pacearchaeota archaeon]
MERKRMIYWGVGVAVVLVLVFSFGFVGNGPKSPVDEIQTPENTAPIPAAAPAPVPTPSVPQPVNFGNYNIDYMNDNIKATLVRQAGTSGKTAFYLPPTGYINVSRGTKYGVAWLVQNVNPKIPEGSEFSFNFAVDPTSVGNCGVSAKVAQGWIERGMASTGMISGRWRQDWNEWYDAMTIYFAFPSDVKTCNIKYNFVITKDGVAYDSRVLEFNLI